MKFYKDPITVEEAINGTDIPRLTTPLPEDLHDIITRRIPNSLRITVAGAEAVYENFATYYLGKGKDIYWSRRFQKWDSKGDLWMYLKDGVVYLVKYSHEEHYRDWATKHLIPVFNSYRSPTLDSIISHVTLTKCDIEKYFISAETINGSTHFINTAGIINYTTKETNMKNYFKNLNKEAAHTTAQLSVGKAANQTVAAALQRSFPWYARLFGKTKDVLDNPIARLATAEAAAMAAQQFAPGNKNLKYVTEAMVTEAMADLAMNSSVMKSTLEKLEELAQGLPNIERE